LEKLDIIYIITGNAKSLCSRKSILCSRREEVKFKEGRKINKFWLLGHLEDLVLSTVGSLLLCLIVLLLLSLVLLLSVLVLSFVVALVLVFHGVGGRVALLGVGVGV